MVKTNKDKKKTKKKEALQNPKCAKGKEKELYESLKRRCFDKREEEEREKEGICVVVSSNKRESALKTREKSFVLRERKSSS